jgi:hypothetical protein
MGAWRSTQGERDLAAIDAHCNLILRPSKREADSLFAGEQRTLGKLSEDGGEFFAGERSVVSRAE